MTNPEITAAKKLGARAAKVADAAQTAATDHLAAADAWDALARHATT